MKLIDWLRGKRLDWVTFRGTMRSWLGEGGRPVEKGLAQSRADMCRRCKFNRAGIITEFGGDAVKLYLEAKARRRLGVFGEVGLRICSLCGCSLKLKIWVPHVHIRRYQKEETRQRIAAGMPSCWQLRNDK